jgi:hypothetical protein
VEKFAEALADARYLRALEVNGAIRSHKDLDSLEAAVLAEWGGSILVHELVGKVFDGVAEFLESVAGFWSDAAADAGGLRGEG